MNLPVAKAVELWSQVIDRDEEDVELFGCIGVGNNGGAEKDCFEGDE